MNPHEEGTNTQTKEISKGVFLKKKMIKLENPTDGAEAVYVFRVEVKTI